MCGSVEIHALKVDLCDDSAGFVKDDDLHIVSEGSHEHFREKLNVAHWWGHGQGSFLHSEA